MPGDALRAQISPPMPGSLMLALPSSRWPAFRYSKWGSFWTVMIRSYQPRVRESDHRSVLVSPGLSDNLVGLRPVRRATSHPLRAHLELPGSALQHRHQLPELGQAGQQLRNPGDIGPEGILTPRSRRNACRLPVAAQAHDGGRITSTATPRTPRPRPQPARPEPAAAQIKRVWGS